MIYLGVLLGVFLMAAMIYMALDKKSNFATRVASLIALAVMILAVIVCLFIIFTDTTVPIDESVVIVGAPKETKQVNNNDIMVLMLLIIFLVILFGFVVYFTMKEHKKSISNIKSTSIPKW